MTRLTEQHQDAEDDVSGQGQQPGVSQGRQASHQPEEQTEGARGIRQRGDEQNEGGEDGIDDDAGQ